ncbi:hypothetical protein [Streptomyces sp. NPDC055506]
MGRSRGVAVLVAGLVLAVGGCGGEADEKDGSTGETSASPTPARPPSRELVKWTGGMCATASEFKRLRAESTADLKQIRDTDNDLFPEAPALAYFASTMIVVQGEESDLDDLGPSGVPAADRMRETLRKKVQGVLTELRARYPDVGVDDAEAVDKLVQSLAPRPDLPALTKKDPRLAAAYERAEQCAPGWKPPLGETSSPSPEPTGPLPEAKDGRNYGACSDGACEVLVSSTADVTANGVNVHITVGNSVTFRTPGTIMNLGGQGGVAQFGRDLKVTVVARNDKGAVLKFAVP